LAVPENILATIATYHHVFPIGRGVAVEKYFWLDRWHQRQIGFHQSSVNIHRKKYWLALVLNGAGKVPVPLCGKSRDMPWLTGQGHSITGVEISDLAVEDFFAENNPDCCLENQGAFKCFGSEKLTLLEGDLPQKDIAGNHGLSPGRDVQPAFQCRC
jgi:thiopurine S-methyltransferase